MSAALSDAFCCSEGERGKAYEAVLSCDDAWCVSFWTTRVVTCTVGEDPTEGPLDEDCMLTPYTAVSYSLSLFAVVASFSLPCGRQGTGKSKREKRQGKNEMEGRH